MMEEEEEVALVELVEALNALLNDINMLEADQKVRENALIRRIEKLEKMLTVENCDFCKGHREFPVSIGDGMETYETCPGCSGSGKTLAILRKDTP